MISGFRPHPRLRHGPGDRHSIRVRRASSVAQAAIHPVRAGGRVLRGAPTKLPLDTHARPPDSRRSRYVTATEKRLRASGPRTSAFRGSRRRISVGSRCGSFVGADRPVSPRRSTAAMQHVDSAEGGILFVVRVFRGGDWPRWAMQSPAGLEDEDRDLLVHLRRGRRAAADIQVRDVAHQHLAECRV